MFERLWRKGNPHSLLVEIQIGAATKENSLELTQKIKSEIFLLPRYSTSGNSFEETQNINFKEYIHSYVH